ncbi:hypothetical protein Plhal304r1_c038g0114271 [Plasmopara halstedii]
MKNIYPKKTIRQRKKLFFVLLVGIPVLFPPLLHKSRTKIQDICSCTKAHNLKVGTQPSDGIHTLIYLLYSPIS